MTLRTEHISQCSRIKARKIDLFLVFRTEHISQCSRISAGLSTIWDEFRTEHISQCSRIPGHHRTLTAHVPDRTHLPVF